MNKDKNPHAVTLVTELAVGVRMMRSSFSSYQDTTLLRKQYNNMCTKAWQKQLINVISQHFTTVSV